MHNKTTKEEDKSFVCIGNRKIPFCIRLVIGQAVDILTGNGNKMDDAVVTSGKKGLLEW